MMEFNELEDVPNKIDWCQEHMGQIIPNGCWSWDYDTISYEERTGIVIKIEDDDMALAFKLRWA